MKAFILCMFFAMVLGVGSVAAQSTKDSISFSLFPKKKPSLLSKIGSFFKGDTVKKETLSFSNNPLAIRTAQDWYQYFLSERFKRKLQDQVDICVAEDYKKVSSYRYVGINFRLP